MEIIIFGWNIMTCLCCLSGDWPIRLWKDSVVYNAQCFGHTAEEYGRSGQWSHLHRHRVGILCWKVFKKFAHSLSCELFVFSLKLTIYLSKIGRNGTGQIPRILLGEGASAGDGVSCSSLQGTDLSGRPE